MGGAGKTRTAPGRKAAKRSRDAAAEGEGEGEEGQEQVTTEAAGGPLLRQLAAILCELAGEGLGVGKEGGETEAASSFEWWVHCRLGAGSGHQVPCHPVSVVLLLMVAAECGVSECVPVHESEREGVKEKILLVDRHGQKSGCTITWGVDQKLLVR